MKQEDFVIKKLDEVGVITRNECLRKYISRLGAIICNLKKDGYVFDAGFIKTRFGQDYQYILLKKPDKK